VAPQSRCNEIVSQCGSEDDFEEEEYKKGKKTAKKHKFVK
jgi:hypothetical protein